VSPRGLEEGNGKKQRKKDDDEKKKNEKKKKSFCFDRDIARRGSAVRHAATRGKGRIAAQRQRPPDQDVAQSKRRKTREKKRFF
jgi:hypothetical protein